MAKNSQKNQGKKGAPAQKKASNIAQADAAPREQKRGSETVTFTSKDDQVIELSINNKQYKGKSIEVPASQADDILRILTGAGFSVERE